MAGTDDDRRRHPRVRLDGRTGGRATVFADFKVVALSEDGACLEMATPLALDSQCDISLNLAHVTVDLRGRVVHIDQPAEAAGSYHIGISFVKVEALDRALLESFLDRERQRARA
jgi:hypothetical protein